MKKSTEVLLKVLLEKPSPWSYHHGDILIGFDSIAKDEALLEFSKMQRNFNYILNKAILEIPEALRLTSKHEYIRNYKVREEELEENNK